ncbi:MAG: sigma-70 family RNA polymerase sigma factor [bacterium]|nr:sigma-70 family RNA polymerase sigma factor [bacterium]
MSGLVRLFVVLATGSPRRSEEVDWFAELEAIGREDLAALARVRRLVTVQLIRLGAYEQHDAWDDLAQEVVIRSWRAHRDGKIKEAARFPGFVRSATRNAYVDWLRSRRRVADVPDESMDRIGEPESDGRALDPGTQLVLRNALERLPERLRVVVEAIYVEGLSYDEAAERLGRPRGTINRQQREAMSHLRKSVLAAGGGSAE